MFTSNELEAVPYCGLAPLPDELWSRWNFDPWVIAAIAALAVAGYARVRGNGVSSTTQSTALSAAVALLIVVFVSPLCALASALFSARVFHHMVLISGVAPLLAAAFRPPVDASPRRALSVLALLHAIILWIWHVPTPYRLALSSDAIYWAMQLSLLGSAYLLWREVLAPSVGRGPVLLTLLGTVIQMGLLGALLVFAPRALFTPHFGATLPFGLTELQDQQLAGLLMWVPAMLPYLGVALALSARWLRSSDQPVT